MFESLKYCRNNHKKAQMKIMHEIAQQMIALAVSSAEKLTTKPLFLNCLFRTVLLVRKLAFIGEMSSV